jgi:hypothetical protein
MKEYIEDLRLRDILPICGHDPYGRISGERIPCSHRNNPARTCSSLYCPILRELFEIADLEPEEANK